VVTILVFITTCTDFFITIQKRRRSGMIAKIDSLWQRRVFLVGLAVATLCVLVRSVFRVAELWEGWDGKLMRSEGTFIALEGVVLVVAVACLAFISPGWGFKDGHVWKFGDVSLRKFKKKGAKGSPP